MPTLRVFVIVSLLVLALILTAVPALADDVYHSRHLALTSVDGSPLRSGFVENIHANGPQVFAHENYLLNGAVPNTDFEVWLMIYVGDPICSSASPIELNTATVSTNAAGNGMAKAVFTPEDAGALRGLTIGAVWEFRTGDAVRYTTACSVVQLD